MYFIVFYYNKTYVKAKTLAVEVVICTKEKYFAYKAILKSYPQKFSSQRASYTSL